MRIRVAGILLPITLLGAAVAAPAQAVPAVQRSTTPVVLVAPAVHDVNQGDLFSVTVKVGAARLAKTVQIQAQTKDIYGKLEWTLLKTANVHAEATHVLKVMADGVDSERFRAVATYRDRKPVVSKAFAVTVWTWTDLSLISSYYETFGISSGAYSQFGMNGDQYIGWYTYDRSGMWEQRYTPGRHCKAFRGVFGVSDSSADGSSAQFTVLTDETNVVYQSPTLVPGAVTDVQFDLALPYRLSIQARNTSPDGVLSYPAIGNPQLLCTGL